MAKDGKSINRKSAKLIHSGNGREANKLIKVGEWYYLVFSEHKPGTGRYVMARRSKKLFGPYKEEKQLALASREAMEPNQGGIIQGKDGKWYFLTHHGTGDWSGRNCQSAPRYMDRRLAAHRKSSATANRHHAMGSSHASLLITETDTFKK